MTRFFFVLLVSTTLLNFGCNKADSQAPKATGKTETATTPKAAAPGKINTQTQAQKAAPKATKATPTAGGSALLDPSKATETAPATFTVKLETTKGDILIDVTRDWSPLGADRFFNLVKSGYYNDVAFFRVIPGFMAQIGLSGDPKINAVWRQARIKDDAVKQKNTRGMVSFAMAGPNTRTTQFFINFGDNSRLDRSGFSPFGKVQDASMKVVDSLHSGYGEGAPRGRGPSQGRVQMEGNAYLKKDFPKLDYVKKASILGK